MSFEILRILRKELENLNVREGGRIRRSIKGKIKKLENSMITEHINFQRSINFGDATI